ncbi:MAG: glucose-1-phosphate thymidylyltransferase [Bacteroidetes bacterium 4484_249]|nr:MAG: glucose-1-phosphate thymidylyltransferase [Bacteroidetes bacterium 4484_249]
MNYILFDDHSRNNLLPLTFLRPVADIRIGIMTIRKKWERFLESQTSTLTETYLSTKFPIVKDKHNILINGSVCPNSELVDEINSLKPNQALVTEDSIVALNMRAEDLDEAGEMNISGIDEISAKSDFIKINDVWEIFSRNGDAIKKDFDILTKGRKSEKLSKTNRLIGEENIFVEKGAKVEYAILNASSGPIYIGADAEIMENAVIRGPFALCDNSVVKMAAKIYGPTTIGPYCKVGGEVNNSVFFGYSNKAHDGFLGNSVIAEWCNLGADTNNSNLKNSYDEVKLWNYPQKTFVGTGLQFCGLIMGDHSKSGINTMFNTGTVVGVNVNIFGSGFQRNFIPSFSWGSTAGFKVYNIKKAVEVAEAVFARRNKKFDGAEKELLINIFDQTATNRSL